MTDPPDPPHLDPPLLDVDLTIDSLGLPSLRSPLKLSTDDDDLVANFTDDRARLPLDPLNARSPGFELAGPRSQVFFDGPAVAAGIVTCGGLCPGMNNVIRGLVRCLWHSYGVRKIYGFRYGFRGLALARETPPRTLCPDDVRYIHLHGGTMLGSSRGARSVQAMVDRMQELGLDILFCVGGDGGMRGALALYDEVTARAAPICIVGIPKTIDNDLPFVERTFGFDTAVATATHAVHCAHVEATGAPNGVGLVRLMGRHAGFIAASAALAAREVDLVLIPEVPFEVEGPGGVMTWLKERVRARGHAVIVVAEGAGQRHVRPNGETDASGNRRLGDIGQYLRDAIRQHLREEKLRVKYIDPSYIIRATPANAADAIFCGRLAENGVHAAMLGRTGLLVGFWLNRFTHAPLRAVTSRQKTISPDGTLWRSVLDCTGQPTLLL